MEKYSLKNILFSNFSMHVICFIILLSSCYLKFSPLLDKTIDIIYLTISVIIIFLFILKFKFSKFIILFLLYLFFLAISTLANSTSSITLFIKTYFRIISMLFYIEWGLKVNCKGLIKALRNVFVLLIFINFFTILTFKNGLYSTDYYSNNWFFGYDNTHIFMYLPGIFLSIIMYELNKTKRNKSILLFLLLIVSFSVYYCFSANSVVAFTILLLYLIFHNQIDKIKIFNAKTYFLVTFIAFFAIVIFRLQNLFSWLIVDILHKDLTFSHRIDIWNNAIIYIKKRIILGYGIEETNIIASKFGGIFFTHAHNTILDVIYKGGIISATLFFSLIYSAIKKLYNLRNTTIAKKLSVILLSVFLTFTFEAREDKVGLYIILILSYNLSEIIRQFKNNNKEMIDNE